VFAGGSLPAGVIDHVASTPFQVGWGLKFPAPQIFRFQSGWVGIVIKLQKLLSNMYKNYIRVIP
jgi:hypothetical protein